MERWLLSSEKSNGMHGYHVYSNIWEAAVVETPVCIRDPRNAHDSYAAAGSNYSWWQIFVGLIFMVEGIHENFNTTKVSVYTISFTYAIIILCIIIMRVVL